MTVDFRFVYKDGNGQLCVVVPTEQYVNQQLRAGQSLEDIKQHLIEKDVLPYTSEDKTFHEVKAQDIPSDRYFRNAWDHDEKGSLQIDRAKAEQIHMDKLRRLRDDKLKKLDVDFMMALEVGDEDSKKTIVATKQALRDMPINEDLSKFTIEELKEYKPDYLKD